MAFVFWGGSSQGSPPAACRGVCTKSCRGDMMRCFVFPALAFLLGVMLQGAMVEALMKENDQLEEMFNNPMASLVANVNVKQRTRVVGLTAVPQKVIVASGSVTFREYRKKIESINSNRVNSVKA